MTISSISNRVSYAGNGSTTAFSVSFPFFAEDELLVIIETDSDGSEDEQTLTTDYTVSGGEGSTGTVTMGTAPASGETLHIIRDTEAVQETDLVNNSAMDAETLEDAFDRRAMREQRLFEHIDRSLRVPETESALSRLPKADDRKGKVFAFDASTGLPDLVDKADLGGGAASAGDVVGTLSALKATDVSGLSGGEAIFMSGRASTGDGGEGWFVFRNSDKSTEVTNDSGEGVWVPPDSQTDGSSGAWERLYTGPVLVEWFGGQADDGTTDNATPIQNAIDFLPAVGGRILLGDTQGAYHFGSSITVNKPVHIEGGLGGLQYSAGGGAFPELRYAGSGVAITVNSSGLGSRIEKFFIEHTGTGTVFFDLDSSCALANIVCRNPDTALSTAFIRVGNTNNVVSTQIDNVFLDDSGAVGALVDQVGNTIWFHQFRLKGHTKGVVIGNTNRCRDVYFSECLFENDSTGQLGIEIVNVDNVQFDKCYWEHPSSAAADRFVTITDGSGRYGTPSFHQCTFRPSAAMEYCITQAGTALSGRLSFANCHLDDSTTSDLTAFVEDTGDQPINFYDWYQRGSSAPLADPITNVVSINELSLSAGARSGVPVLESNLIVDMETTTVGASGSHTYDSLPASDAGSGDTSKYIVIGESGPDWGAEFFGHKTLGTGTVYAGGVVTINDNTDPATGSGLDIWVDASGYVNLTNNSGISRRLTVIRIAD